MLFTSGCSHPSFSLPWRILLAHLVALHLLHLGSAQFRVVAPDPRVTAIVGQDVVLRCQLSPCKNAWSSDIRWIQHRSSDLVHHYQDGEDLEQMEEYKGRTELLRDGLSDGNLDLRITAVSSSDSGSYSCAVQEGDGYAEAVVELEVSDPFPETVHPWKVALGVVITLLVASLGIIVFLHRMRVAQSRMLKGKDAALAEQAERLNIKDAVLEELPAIFGLSAENLKKLASKLEEQTEKLEKRNLSLKKQYEKLGLNAVNLKKDAAELGLSAADLMKQTEALENRKSLFKKDCEEMALRAADLKNEVEKLVKEIKEVEKHYEKMERRDAKLENMATELVQRTEALEKRNSELRKHCDEMELTAADLLMQIGKPDSKESEKTSKEQD